MKPRARTIMQHVHLSAVDIDDELVYASALTAEKEPRLLVANHDGSDLQSVPVVMEVIGKIWS